MTARKESLFSFPNPVNEYSARFVAGGVVILTSASILVGHFLGWYWLLVPLAYGFWARVLSGPKLSPLALFVTKWLIPKLGVNRPTAGPPKRFAQGIGAVFSSTALVLAFAGLPGIAWIVLGGLIFAATLESVFNFCLGCRIFGILMRFGVIPERVCRECTDYLPARLRPGF
ncbi:MAG: DUF4395 domain-containing protein [Chloroflexi bacterium]|nr:DUF4395 domain-containing protein [Chloroflexota bacterium]